MSYSRSTTTTPHDEPRQPLSLSRDQKNIHSIERIRIPRPMPWHNIQKLCRSAMKPKKSYRRRASCTFCNSTGPLDGQFYFICSNVNSRINLLSRDRNVQYQWYDMCLRSLQNTTVGVGMYCLSATLANTLVPFL